MHIVCIAVWYKTIETIDTTEADFIAFKREWRAFLVSVRYDEMSNVVATISIEDEIEKHKAGRVGYGGQFEPSKIDHNKEMREEIIDFANYCDQKWFCVYKKDPFYFPALISQYFL